LSRREGRQVDSSLEWNDKVGEGDEARKGDWVMNISVFDFPTKVVFGVGSVSELGREARELGSRALVVTYPEIQKAGLLDRVLKDLSSNGLETSIFDEVEPNTRSSTVDKGSQFALKQKVNLVIGLGGGSAMDAAKAIALASSGSEPIWKYAESKIAPLRQVPPLIQLPTLAGTGAEVSRGAVITNWEAHIKKSIVSPFIQARVAIIDPQLTLTAPDMAVRAGAVDAFSHAVEPYITEEADAPMTDGIRETIMKIVVDYLPRLLGKPNDLEIRTQLSWASMVSMSQIARIGGGGGFMPCHGLGHALSGYYNISHGNSLASLLPAWMRFTQPAREERSNKLAKIVFGDGELAPGFESWLEKVGMNLRLRDLGFKMEKAGEIAALAVKSSTGLRHNPVPIIERTAVQIYQAAY
jgi:alcohol dehydrogenase class IV